MLHRSLILFFCLFLQTVSHASPTSLMGLDEFIKKFCAPLETHIADYAICPKYYRYQISELSLKKALKFLNEEQDLLPDPIAPKEGLEEIMRSVQSHAEYLKNNISPLATSEKIGSSKKFQKFATRFHKKLKKTMKNKMVYLDSATYWAPSVEASSLILIDLKAQTIELIYHGATDG